MQLFNGKRLFNKALGTMFEQAARLGIDLVLSGHTHGGQISLPAPFHHRNVSRIIAHWTRGLFQQDQTLLYVNRGLGVAGPPVRQGVELEGASILDVAPTVLTLLGLPVARDMAGRAWTEAIHSRFLEQYPLTHVDTYRRETAETARAEIGEKDTEILYQRLHDLGYL